MNFCGYIGRDYILSNAYYCVLFYGRVGVRIKFSVWLVSGYPVLFFITFRCHFRSRLLHLSRFSTVFGAAFNYTYSLPCHFNSN